MRAHRLFTVLCGWCPFGLLALSGCGTNFQDILFQVAAATGRTVADGVLTDVANTLGDALDAASPSPPTDQGDGAAPPPDSMNEPPLDEVTGDPTAGEDLFLANNCSACHCDDASGGCALSAPSLRGIDVPTVDERLRGEIEHPGGKFDFTNQDIADIQAFLGSF